MIIMTGQNRPDLKSGNLISISIWRFAEIIFDEYLRGTGTVLLFCTYVKTHKFDSNRDKLSFFPSTNVYCVLFFRYCNYHWIIIFYFQMWRFMLRKGKKIYCTNKLVIDRGGMNLYVFNFPSFSAPLCFQGITPKNKLDYELVNCNWVEVGCLGWGVSPN